MARALSGGSAERIGLSLTSGAWAALIISAPSAIAAHDHDAEAGDSEQGSVRRKFDNYARLESVIHDRTYDRWRIFVDEPPEVLDEIEEVRYVLDPTFPMPHQVRSNRETKFALETTGWSEFYIQITIRYKDGKLEESGYDLDLGKRWPTEVESIADD